jgi:NAD(P)-dependent dehydrogenase (short-subunit alcohol dehydrogenase family)
MTELQPIGPSFFANPSTPYTTRLAFTTPGSGSAHGHPLEPVHPARVNRLWPAIAADGGGRVVSVSSRGHHRSPVRWEDPHFKYTPYDKWEAYGQAKTSNVLFAVHLDTLGHDAGVRAFALRPGGT